ncbi:MAG: family 43 glycosylhydrolase [Clostridia bacterium]|nr:family 43 glycosylhydrolase [Clostridia bacterium]
MYPAGSESADLNLYPYHIRDVHISDPFILADPQTHMYYTYVQFADKKRFPDVPQAEGMRREHFYVLKSPDLIHWSKPRVCFEKKDFWADQDYWAPECHLYKGNYYLISSFRAEGTYRRCQCLRASSPEGPFEAFGEPLTPEGWQCLDGTLYVDPQGKPWLIFCHEWLQVGVGQICACPLSDDLSRAIGESVILFRSSDGRWTGDMLHGGDVTDGPFVYTLPSGKLLMLWSSFTQDGGYATSYAISPYGSILGPWIQREDPLYALDGAHSMLFHTFSGQLMMSLHCPNDHAKKRILLFEMEEYDDGIDIINEVTGNWYQGIGGHGKRYAYGETVRETPCFLKDPRYHEE